MVAGVRAHFLSRLPELRERRYYLHFITSQLYIELARLQNEGNHTELEQEAIKEQELAKEKSFCAICMDDIEMNEVVTRLECPHRFHNHCLHDWIKVKQICPVCKNSI